MAIRILKYALIAIVIASVIFFIYITDFAQVIIQLQSVGSNFIVILCISFLSYFLGCLSWKYCFRSDDVPVTRLFAARTIGEVIAFINPTNIVAGEAAKYNLLDGVSLTKTEKVDSIIIARIILISTQVGLTVICAIWIGYMYHVLLKTCVVVLLIYLVFLLLLKLLTRESCISKRNSNSFSKAVYYYKVQLLRFRMRLHRFYQAQTKRFWKAISISIVHWFVGAGELLFILHILHIDTTIFHTLSVDMGIIILKSIGGFIPGQVGIEELGNKYLLSMIGVQTVGIWLSVSIIRRVRQLCWIGIGCILFLVVFLKSKSHGNPIYHT